MSSTTIGAWGLTLPEIIDTADSFAKSIATFGITEPEQLKFFCTRLGETLTKNYLRLGVAQDLRPYRDRLAGVVGSAVDALCEAGLWQTCADLGPYDGPPIKAERVRRGIETAILGIDTMRHHLGLSHSEILDLLAWKQTVLAVSLLFEQEPNLAHRLGSRTV